MPYVLSLSDRCVIQAVSKAMSCWHSLAAAPMPTHSAGASVPLRRPLCICVTGFMCECEWMFVREFVWGWG